MMSAEYMQQLARDAARSAKRNSRVPESFSSLGTDAIRDRIKNIPFLGSYVPKGYKRVDAPNLDTVSFMACTEGYLFVDASGWGAKGEGALTVQEFVDYIYKNGDGLSFGIVESGQFQVVIATYKKDEKKRAAKSAVAQQAT